MATAHTTVPARAERATAEPAVQVRSLVVAFGGLRAVKGVDLDVASGERLAILGPNGAGKTTLFNVIAGDITPTEGTVAIKGRDCTFLSSRHRPRLGLARTYQKARSFDGLTVRENVCLALAGHRRRQLPLWRGPVDRELADRAAKVAARVWLTDRLDVAAGSLSHGEKRQLEVAMAIATDPDVLLLDEPASGLSRGERERLVELLDELAADVTLLLIEHDMDVAFAVAQRVVVMADGEVVAAGSPDQVRSDPTVHRIYLGVEG
ncbi:ABC transporter ATP-binding protein [Isoptericola variabilis]|uniref:Monosaccharide-transporting ATPase n=1 Tax=Isoptericola variabilis (strain 225) TaxID=743718 RepID=F6FWM4_ISOV2|nr:ABC transporter ATP-binding protein [Isoptericola variabilis]AEG45665.1 Monosaccharide-transporting ATPase [Isoptericola variabilis 225]